MFIYSVDLWRDLEVIKDLRPLSKALKKFVNVENAAILHQVTAPSWWPSGLDWKISASSSSFQKKNELTAYVHALLQGISGLHLVKNENNKKN